MKRFIRFCIIKLAAGKWCPVAALAAWMLAAGMSVSSAQTITINFNALTGTPFSYTESGMTVTSLWPNPSDNPHLHAGFNSGDLTNDLHIHANCCSPPYGFSLGGTPFTVVSVLVLNVSSGYRGNFVSSASATQTITGNGTINFPATGWTGITSFIWNAFDGTADIDNLVIRIGSGCPAHAHGHVSTESPGHFGALSNPHVHHAQHGTHLPPNPTCPPHAFGHIAGAAADPGEGLYQKASAPEPDFVVAFNADWTTGPARRGAALQLFGPARGLFLDGQDRQAALDFTPPASGKPLYYTTSVPEVRVGGAPAKVLFSGLAPGLKGVWQINVLVPEETPAGAAAIEITFDGVKLTSVSVAVE